MGKNNESIAYFDKALAIDPSDVESWNGKGLALTKLGNYYEAIKYFDKASSIKPNYAAALDNKQKTLDLLKKQ